MSDLMFKDCGVLMNVALVSIPGLAVKEGIRAEPAASPAILVLQLHLHSRLGLRDIEFTI